MRRKGYRGKRCIKKRLSKCEEVFRAYDDLQLATADVLDKDDDIIEIQCNVPLAGPEVENYTTDFVCKKSDGSIMVRECIYRKYITKPLNLKMLDMSYLYWKKQGVTDWGIAIDKQKGDNDGQNS